MKFNDFLNENGISQTNRVIVLDYIDSMLIDERRLASGTIQRNIEVMHFILKHIKTDLDKLTIRDINTYKRTLLEWKRVDGEPVSDVTKNQYFVGIKRFLVWYEETVDENCGYTKLSKQIKIRKSKSKKLPSDLLTVEEIMSMIKITDDDRDRAIIATLADCGCRIGELGSCRIKDVAFSGDECHLTFPQGKTGSRTVLIEFAAEYISQWIRKHPYNDNPDAPLWISKKRKNVGSKNEKKFECHAIDYDSLYGIVKRTAAKAGIKKRIHPHLFRHTAATRLSSKLSEAALKAYLGWSSDSSMPATYIHLSGKDVDNQIRLMNGTAKVEVKDEGSLKVIRCIRCNTVVPAGGMYCLKCGLPLTIDAKNADNTLNQALATFFAQNPDMQATLMKNILSAVPK